MDPTVAIPVIAEKFKKLPFGGGSQWLRFKEQWSSIITTNSLVSVDLPISTRLDCSMFFV